MNVKTIAFLLFYLVLAQPLMVQGADKWLIAARHESFNTGQKILVDVVKPDNIAGWPDNIALNLSGAGASEIVQLKRIKEGAANDSRQTYAGTPSTKFIGVVRAALADYESNRMLMLAASHDDIAPLEIAATT